MSQERPDTDEKNEPAGTPSPGHGSLTAKPLIPGDEDARSASAVPGAYDADDVAQESGKAVKPGN